MLTSNICRLGVLKVATEHSSVKPCLGVHPCLVSSHLNDLSADTAITKAQQMFEEVEKLVRSNLDHVVGLGECGLDFLPHNTKTDQHKEVRTVSEPTKIPLIFLPSARRNVWC